MCLFTAYIHVVLFDFVTLVNMNIILYYILCTVYVLLFTFNVLATGLPKPNNLVEVIYDYMMTSYSCI